ncbi:AAA family ATPase [Xylophilus sp. GOD-11R]|uniref:AAA family ATPase n=1 Tax=Xylophilus sp. GOD-11R TaxID=3089814 RepID=UPI00298D0EF9|nr:AAA family ATPase [Xylophilus sp. GOD-11R]WPB57370.1 AAA family ATPase [Xylophilus sp. GOD-11R]
MHEPIEERDALWSEFLAQWPIERLQTMAPEEYSKAGDKDCLTYWLEKRTEALGSIWGGSAFKFGIYGRKDQTPKTGTDGVQYGTEYAWATKYGASAQQAFETVRALVVAVAQAARSGDLKIVEAADMGNVTKWKIAFLYQDRQAPQILNIYKAAHLQKLADAGQEKPMSELHQQLIAQRGDQHLLAYGDALWHTIEAAAQAQLTFKATQEQLQAASFMPIQAPVEKIAGYRCGSGAEIAVALNNTLPVTLYLSAGAWLATVSAVLRSIDEFGPDKPRTGALGTNAPTLGPGHAIVKVRVPTAAVLEQLLEAYDAPTGETLLPATQAATVVAPAQAPLNQIFYGPPGTGKTHRTVDEAVRIIDPEFHAAHLHDRPMLKQRYDSLVEQQRVRFVTFHQSFAYEDFVEGLRPVPGGDGGMPQYEVADGIFKSICLDAGPRVTASAPAPSGLESRTVWKMSLGNTQSDEANIFDECIDQGYALLGYGKNVDFSGVQSLGDISAAYRAAGHDPDQMNTYAVTSVALFVLKLQRGDLLIVTEGNAKFRAIGEVTGDYEYAPRDEEDGFDQGFAQRRAVKWLRVYSPALPYGELMKKLFVQRTLYRIGPDSLDRARLEALLTDDPHPAETSAAEMPRVLVIDEINRGNVSRVFGELITLLEPSKRTGGPEALQVTLPYSKLDFGVPTNIHLIGTMNTADRSLATLDIALRRRFSFIEVRPRPELLDSVVIEEKIALGDLLRALNDRIELLLDRDHCIGHAYFLGIRHGAQLSALADVFRWQILPLLQEYFFEDWSRIRLVLNDHRKPSSQHQFLVRPDKSMESLLGATEAGMREDKRWVLNVGAFNFADSYVGTIGA